jgi:hypothetical protein
VAHEKESEDLTVTLHGDVGPHVLCGWMTYIDGLAISRLCNIPNRHLRPVILVFPPSAARTVNSLHGFPS